MDTNMTRYDYDCIVLGSGPAGGEIAATLAQAGRRVAMTESRAIGGVCPLRGCNPKKVLLGAAEAVDAARKLQGKGLVGEPAVHWPELMAFKRSFTEPVPDKAGAHYESLGIDIYEGPSRLTGPHEADADGEAISGASIAVAVGMVPRSLPIPGTELTIDSDAFLELDELPERIVFIGGGFVAMEFAHMAARCGSRCTLLVRSGRALRQFDPDLVEALLAAGPEAGVETRLFTPTTAIERHGDGYVARGGKDGGTSFEADLVVNCAGRVPATAGLGLDAAGVEAGPGGVVVNEYMQSVSAPHVYAAGDVAATPFALTPTATIEARAAAHNILHGNQRTPDRTGVPSVVFSLPPLAAAGLSEEDARRSGMNLEVLTGDLAESFSWKRLGETHGAYKLLLDADAGVLVGAHVFGHSAEELINTFALAIRHAIPVDRLRDTVWAYPTCGYQLKHMFA